MKYKDYLLELLDEKEMNLNKELYCIESLFRYVKDEEYISNKNHRIQMELELLDKCREHIKHFM